MIWPDDVSKILCVGFDKRFVSVIKQAFESGQFVEYTGALYCPYEQYRWANRFWELGYTPDYVVNYIRLVGMGPSLLTEEDFIIAVLNGR